MTANGYTPSYFDLRERTFLPQLPKNVKNENMENSRQLIRTTNEEYGKYWNGATQSTALPPTYLTDPTPEAIAATSRWYRSRYRSHDDWSHSGALHRSPDFRYVLDHRRNGSHRNNYDLIENAGLTATGVAWTDRPDWYRTTGNGQPYQLSTYRNGPSTLWPITSEDRVRRNRYKVAIGDRLNRQSANGSNWTLSDINRVDLNVHLNDATVVTVPDIPFYFE
jgi:hypothetical protein